MAKERKCNRAVIQFGFSASEAARLFHVSERTAQIVLAEKLGEGTFKHQNRAPDHWQKLKGIPLISLLRTLKVVDKIPGQEQTEINRLRATNLRSRRAILS